MRRKLKEGNYNKGHQWKRKKQTFPKKLYIHVKVDK